MDSASVDRRKSHTGSEGADMACINEEQAPVEPGAKSGQMDNMGVQQGGLQQPTGSRLGGW